MSITVVPQGPDDRLTQALLWAVLQSGREVKVRNSLAPRLLEEMAAIQGQEAPHRQPPSPEMTTLPAQHMPTFVPPTTRPDRSNGSTTRPEFTLPPQLQTAQALAGPASDSAQHGSQLPPAMDGNADGHMRAALRERARRELAAQQTADPIEVELPDGTVVEFPAGTADAVMKAALTREFGGGAGTASGEKRAATPIALQRPRSEAALDAPQRSYRELMDAARRAHHAGDIEAARRLVTLAVPRRLESEGLKEAPDQRSAVEPQIVGDTILPPAPENGTAYAPTGAGPSSAKSAVYRAGDAAGEALASTGAGLSRGMTSLADLPGLAVSAGGQLGLWLQKKAGLIDEQQADNAQGLLGAWQVPRTGSGDTFRTAARGATGGASEYRSDTTLGQYAGTAAEFIPGALALGGASIGNALRYGLLPGVASETAGQLTSGTAVEPWARAGAAMAAAPVGNALEAGTRRAISPYGGADQGRQALAQVLDDAGVPLSAGQRVGSEALRRREGMTAGGQALNEAQREALTRAALRTAGSDASRATPEVLAATAKRIGGVFDDVARGVDVRPDPATVNALARANDTYKQLAPKSSQAPIVGEVVRQMTAAFRSGRSVPAATVNSWRSNLSKLTTSSDNATRAAAAEAMDALDTAMTQTLTSMGRTNDAARLAEARTQWRNFVAIQKAATGAGEGAAAGILSPSALRNAVVQQGRAAYAQGRRGDLGELSRAAEGVIKALPTSGTAENIRALGVPMLGWTGAGAGLGAALGGPVGAAVGSGAGTAIPGLLGAIRMSRPAQAWLGNQLARPGGPIVPMNALAPLPSALSPVNRQ